MVRAEDRDGPGVITKQDLRDEEMKVTPEEFKQSRPDPPNFDEVVSSMEDLAEHTSHFASLFLPQARAAIWDVLLHLDEHPHTAAEICERGAKVSPASFSRHKDVFLDYGILLEAGTDERGTSYTSRASGTR